MLSSMKDKQDGSLWKENPEEIKDSLLSVNVSGNKAKVLGKSYLDASDSPQQNVDENSQVEMCYNDKKGAFSWLNFSFLISYTLKYSNNHECSSQELWTIWNSFI